MLRYIGKRILIAIPTFLGITVLVYVLSSMAPGTPLEMIFNDPNATAEQMAAMKAKLGLDQPVMIQYFNWLVQLRFFRNYPFLCFPTYLSFASNKRFLQRPYIVRFIIFNRLFVPSTKPLL